MRYDDTTLNEAHERLEAARSEFLAKARTEIKLFQAMTNRPVSTEDVRELCPPPEGVDHRIMGTVFNRAEWRPVGYTVARGHCNPRSVRTWLPK
jgi:hypothetical protein